MVNKKSKTANDPGEDEGGRGADSSNGDPLSVQPKRRSYKLYLAGLVVVAVAVAVGAFLKFQESDLDIHEEDIISQEALELFTSVDLNNDGYLSPKEFDRVFFMMHAAEQSSKLIEEIELENVSSFGVLFYSNRTSLLPRAFSV